MQNINKKLYVNNRTIIYILLIVGVIVSSVLSMTVLNSFFYTPKEGTVNLTITATGEKNKDSWGTDVRIQSIIVNEKKEININDIETDENWNKNGSSLMTTKATKDNPLTLNLVFENVENATVKFIKQEGSGNVRINANGKEELIDLYSPTWNTIEYMFSNNEHLPLLVVIIRFLTVLIIVEILIAGPFYTRLYENNKRSIYVNHITHIVYIFIIPLIFSYGIQLIQLESTSLTINWIARNIQPFIMGYIIIFLIYSAFLCAGRVWVSTFITGFIAFIFASLNYFKYKFRNEPFLPWDLISAAELKIIMPQLNIELTSTMIVCIILYLFLTIYSSTIKPYMFKKLSASILVRTILFAIIMIIGFNYVNFTFYNKEFLSNNDIEINQWQQTETYNDNGVVSAFILNTKNLLIEQPADYSKETMNKLHDHINTITSSRRNKNIQPNIIAIMSEGFWDVTELPGVEFDEELLPTYNNLKENFIFGHVLSPKFGGGTSNVEFEVLTGFANEFLPPNAVPYQQYILKPTFSVAGYLKSRGYTTLALHSYGRKFWNRDTAYKNLSFDEYLDKGDFESPNIKRSFISDMDVSKKIISEYEKHEKENDSPWFNFVVTMQNHMPYSEDRWNGEELVKVKANNLSDKEESSLKDLATGLHNSDLALKYLLDYFEKIDEPTIVIFFGDHMNSLGDTTMGAFEETGFLQDNYTDLDAAYKLYRTPIIIWSNFSDIKKEIGDISAFQVMPTVMDLFDLDMPDYFKFLNYVKSISRGYTRDVVLDSEGIPSFELNDNQADVYKKFNLIQYDYMFGARYLDNIFK